MNDEIFSLDHNDVWNPIKLLSDFKPFKCTWVFKTKKDSRGKVDCFKVRLVAK